MDLMPKEHYPILAKQGGEEEEEQHYNMADSYMKVSSMKAGNLVT